MTDEPDLGGRPPHEPTPGTREQVKAWAVVGVAQEVMARQLEIDPKTLRKHYRDELDMSLAMANATIAGVLFKKAQAGDTASVFFWLKTQAGWRETNRVEVTGAGGGPVQIIDPSKLSTDAMAELLAAMDNAAPETEPGGPEGD